MLITSYPESNYDVSYSYYSGGNIYAGESFQNTSDANLDSCQFYISKGGSPTGNVYAKLYAHTGVFGTSSLPTGSALATSDALDISTLTTSISLKTFSFSGANRIALTASTYYCLEINFGGGNSSNYLSVGADSSASTYPGNSNFSSNGTTWSTSNTDRIFYIYNDIDSSSSSSMSSSSSSKSSSSSSSSSKSSSSSSSSKSSSSSSSSSGSSSSSSSSSLSSSSSSSSNSSSSSSSSSLSSSSSSSSLSPSSSSSSSSSLSSSSSSSSYNLTGVRIFIG